MEAKYDSTVESDLRAWIEAKSGDQISGDFQTALKDGVVLCHLVNALKPGAVPKINQTKMAFKQMENIGAFLRACELLGVEKESLFMTVDLYEGKNMAVVLDTLTALRRKWN